MFARAQDALLANDLVTARPALESLLRIHPGDAQLSMMLAGALIGQGHLRDATQCLLDALPALPPIPEVNAQVARYLYQLGESRGTHDCLERPVMEVPRAAAGLAAMGMMWQMLGVPEQALARLDRASELGFDDAAHQFYRGLQLHFLGRTDEACVAWQRCLATQPGYGRAFLSWVRSARIFDRDAMLVLAEKGIAVAEQGSVDQASFEFARFHLLDDDARAEAAWTALQRGNALMAARSHDGPTQFEQQIEAMIALCDAEWIEPIKVPLHEGPQPIFILGMPRSGTTLLERILGNHTQVIPVGELNDFWQQMRRLADQLGQGMLDERLLESLPSMNFTELGVRYLAQTQWRAGDTPYFIDKLPSNVHIAGLIHKALPQAPILHLVRDPMDVCYSNYKAMFGESYNYSYDLDHLGAYYHQYSRLMRHWHQVMPGAILDVSYAGLVQDTEATVRKVLEFCRLPFEPTCLDIKRNTAPVTTLSTAQVREGIHTRALGEWQRYARQLEPLRAALSVPPLSS